VRESRTTNGRVARSSSGNWSGLVDQGSRASPASNKPADEAAIPSPPRHQGTKSDRPKGRDGRPWPAGQTNVPRATFRHSDDPTFSVPPCLCGELRCSNPAFTEPIIHHRGTETQWSIPNPHFVSSCLCGETDLVRSPNRETRSPQSHKGTKSDRPKGRAGRPRPAGQTNVLRVTNPRDG
jgi:hypothetical protein